MGGLWIYNDGREVPDTFLTAADYPSKYSMTVQSSQVNENGPTDDDSRHQGHHSFKR